MNIYNNLPSELQRKIKYLLLEHPCARIIKDEIIKLKCDRIYKFKVDDKCICRINGLDFFYTTYFEQFEKTSSCTSTHFHEEFFDALFDVLSDTTDDDII